MNKPQQSEQSPKGSISEADTGTVAGIVIGSLSALFVLVIVVSGSIIICPTDGSV